MDDVRDLGGRLVRLVLACAIGAILTILCCTAIDRLTGHGHHHHRSNDFELPVIAVGGAAIVACVYFALNALVRRRPRHELPRARIVR